MSFDFNYISNIKAYFYENIIFGNMLHNQFKRKNTFQSNFFLNMVTPMDHWNPMNGGGFGESGLN